MTNVQRAGYTAKEFAIDRFVQATPSTFYQQTMAVPLGKPTSKTWPSTLEEERSLRSYYDIGAERTNEDFQKEYDIWMSRLTPQLHEYIDIDLPLVDSGGDW